MVDGGMACIKYILMIFNLVFVIFGILLIYFGFNVVNNAADFKDVIQTPDTTAFVLIVVGFAIFIVAFLGCCGAARHSHCMLFSFSIILMVILLVELIAGGLAIAFRKDLRHLAESGLNETLIKYNWTSSDDSFTKLIDDMQSHIHCCGMNNASDWNNLFPDHDDLPESCCQKTNDSAIITLANHTTCSVNSDTLYRKGCIEAFEEAMKDSIGPLGGIALATGLIQILGIVFAFCLGRHLQKNYEVV